VVVEEERVEALLERLAVCVSVSSSYSMDSVGVTRNEGAANRKPPVAIVFLESLLPAVVELCTDDRLHFLVRLLAVWDPCVRIAEDADRMIEETVDDFIYNINVICTQI